LVPPYAIAICPLLPTRAVSPTPEDHPPHPVVPTTTTTVTVMDDSTNPVMVSDAHDGVAVDVVEEGATLDELLVEEISIDGMCGVY